MKPKPAEPRYYVKEIPICTPGNLVTVAAAEKAGKTAWIGAMMAATMSATGDFLGVTSSNPNGLALLHLDTEQSEHDHYVCGERVARRAGLSETPPWFYSYYVADVRHQVREALPQIMAELAKEHGGIHSVFVDGAADVIDDVNDAKQANPLVCELHKLAMENHCPIIGAIHFNPKSKTKTRGHLGSQLERKAESNLYLKRDGDVTTVWADKNRHAPIPKDIGPRFVFSPELQLHVSVECAGAAKQEAERKELTKLAEGIFAECPVMRRKELEATVKTKLKVSESSAYRKVDRMIELTVIKKTEDGLYTFAGFTE
jgi:hypothetical protein